MFDGDPVHQQPGRELDHEHDEDERQADRHQPLVAVDCTTDIITLVKSIVAT